MSMQSILQSVRRIDDDVFPRLCAYIVDQEGFGIRPVFQELTVCRKLQPGGFYTAEVSLFTVEGFLVCLFFWQYISFFSPRKGRFWMNPETKHV